MSESKNVLEGVIVPLLTPIDSKECVDESALRDLIRHCLKGGVDGIFVGGTSGFGPLLTDDQWERLMEIARDEVGDSVPLLGGIIATSTVRAINRIKILDRIGFKHMVVTPTFYVTPTKEEEFLSHFDACRQATDMNMITYNIPSCTGCSIPLSAISKMVSQGWTSIIKESSGDKDYFLELTKVLSGSGATILQGNEPDIAWGLSIGAKGMVPVCANYAPSLFSAAWRASQDGSEALLAELQERIMAVRETLLMGDKCWLAGAMYGVHSLGIGSGKTLRPIQELKDDEKREIDDLTKSESIS
ncbi:MAG: dihydrodipicolinate synthase family protein [Planctomycetes bacterium]|nr:dihydrodipicolinate synthase family protein [Planctomycetota bacterium]